MLLICSHPPSSSNFSTLLVATPVPISSTVFAPLLPIVPTILTVPPNESWWKPGKILRTKEGGGERLDIQPSIVVTRAHIKLSELDETVRRGEIDVDGRIFRNHPPSFPLQGNRNFIICIFGDPTLLSSSSDVHVTLQIHDQSNEATYLEVISGAAQDVQVDMAKDEKKKGVGVVVYFQKEGKALGDVTKYLEYNLRKRGEGSADRYFASTEIIVGVKDMRSQVLMPDVLHWLGSGVSGSGSVGSMSLSPDHKCIAFSKCTD
ncbi:hypothetical protein D9758_016931 [Tetrapyrgos nigripes]|uniref:GTP cyclohydrolase N-terminal domain-containing protein n=1 Tax=Tetrapyrgos nigripes TaxID=182062 RepID=A0A8H5FNE5_9AGAR|nr:hypothetical protein D9758_016931 [Tetrapyrgos nigripes]